MAKPKFLVIRGVLDYAKIVGAPRKHTGLPKYDKGPYWSVDVTPDAKSMALLEENDLLGKLRPKKKADAEKIANDKNRVGKGKFLSLRVLQNNKDGTTNDSPRITDVSGQPWGKKLIGNGSVADVKVKVVDYEGAEAGVYLQAVRILSHVPYEIDEFAPLSPDDEFFGATDEVVAADGAGEVARANGFVDSDLDDDVPF